MRSFIKKRKTLFEIIAIVVVILIFLYCVGFRITYAPKLDNCWEAVSACGTWAAAIMSSIAVIVAISIPKKIASEQNKIALFDKRYDIFYELQKHVSCCLYIKHPDCANLRKRFMCSFEIEPELFEDRQKFISFIFARLNKLRVLPFLFPEISEEKCKALYSATIGLAKMLSDNNTPMSPDDKKIVREYYNCVAAISQHVDFISDLMGI